MRLKTRTEKLGKEKTEEKDSEAALSNSCVGLMIKIFRQYTSRYSGASRLLAVEGLPPQPVPFSRFSRDSLTRRQQTHSLLHILVVILVATVHG
ncbi:hypothetical protein K456DRAFT_48930 [Colletotrichum gloeosporioides 23]|nr:hypothetical protein K456DRAFT_48930 [Colletotrichum gloeosporioides 23]